MSPCQAEEILKTCPGISVNDGLVMLRHHATDAFRVRATKRVVLVSSDTLHPADLATMTEGDLRAWAGSLVERVESLASSVQDVSEL